MVRDIFFACLTRGGVEWVQGVVRFCVLASLLAAGSIRSAHAEGYAEPTTRDSCAADDGGGYYCRPTKPKGRIGVSWAEVAGNWLPEGIEGNAFYNVQTRNDFAASYGAGLFYSNAHSGSRYKYDLTTVLRTSNALRSWRNIENPEETPLPERHTDYYFVSGVYYVGLEGVGYLLQAEGGRNRSEVRLDFDESNVASDRDGVYQHYLNYQSTTLALIFSNTFFSGLRHATAYMPGVMKITPNDGSAVYYDRRALTSRSYSIVVGVGQPYPGQTGRKLNEYGLRQGWQPAFQISAPLLEFASADTQDGRQSFSGNFFVLGGHYSTMMATLGATYAHRDMLFGISLDGHAFNADLDNESKGEGVQGRGQGYDFSIVTKFGRAF